MIAGKEAVSNVSLPFQPEWIWTEAGGRRNQYVAFRLVVEGLSGEKFLESVPVWVSAGNLYRLYLNGHYLGRGPVREWSGCAGLDRYELAPWLQPGRNVLSALVHYFGENVGGWPLSPPGFLLAGSLGKKPLSTGVAAWEAVQITAWNSASPRVNLYNGFTEEVNLRRWDRAIWETGSDRAGWQKAVVVATARGERRFLQPRQIPPLKEILLSPLTLVKAGKNFSLYAAPRLVSGSLEMELMAEKPVKLKVWYSDRLSRGKIEPGVEPENSNTSCDRLKVPVGRHRWYGAFLLRGFRYVQINGKDLQSLKMELQPREILYPCVNRAVFETSDGWLNRCWEMARLTLRLCLADTYLDNPSRERQQYGGDGYLQSLYAFDLFGDLALWRQFLRHFARGQGSDGSHQSGGPWCWNQIIPAWTLLWIESVGEYCRHTRDFSVASQYLSVIEKALKWFSALEEADGLLRVKEQFDWKGGKVVWNFIDWQKEKGQLTGEEARLALNGFYAMALGTAAWLFLLTGKHSLASALKRKRAALIKRLGSIERLPEHALVTATLAGAVSGKMDQLARKIFQHRSRTDVMFLFFTLKSLLQEDQVEAALVLLQDIFSPMMKEGPGTFWETRQVSKGSTRALCQAIGAAPAYWLPRLVTGLREVDADQRQLRFGRPLPGVEEGYVVLPCVDGEIELRSRRGKLVFSRCPSGWKTVVSA
ncbi:MAG TPA: hypothetical protein PKX93_00180 [bacterium]|nr:hypothetical protein [bacterium]